MTRGVNEVENPENAGIFYFLQEASQPVRKQYFQTITDRTVMHLIFDFFGVVCFLPGDRIGSFITLNIKAA